MQTETQKNWNSYFNKKQKKNYKSVIILLLFIGIAISIAKYTYSMDSELLNVSSGVAKSVSDVFDSSYNGVKMARMVDKIGEIVHKNNNYMQELVRCSAGYEPTDPSFIDKWLEFILESKTYINDLKYHSSYDEYISVCNKMIKETESLINEVLACNEKNNNKYIYNSDYVLEINEYVELINDELIKAFQNNGIEHSVRDDKILFQYRLK